MQSVLSWWTFINKMTRTLWSRFSDERSHDNQAVEKIRDIIWKPMNNWYDRWIGRAQTSAEAILRFKAFFNIYKALWGQRINRYSKYHGSFQERSPLKARALLSIVVPRRSFASKFHRTGHGQRRQKLTCCCVAGFWILMHIKTLPGGNIYLHRCIIWEIASDHIEMTSLTVCGSAVVPAGLRLLATTEENCWLSTSDPFGAP